MRFTKMHGAGNDYLYVYGEVPEDIARLSQRLSDRHFGVGGDGMIYISHSDIADFKMRIFNADGSEAKMCGNGIRCVGKYVYDKGYTDRTQLKIETLSGIKTLELSVENGKVISVSVDMGKAAAGEKRQVHEIDLIPVDVGNPHAVIFVDDMDKIAVDKLGPIIERSGSFPDGVNVEFVRVISDKELRMRVWERGSGITLACGTGACATVAAAVQEGYCKHGDSVSVHLDGGTLNIIISENGNVTMIGPAVTVYDGEI